MKKVFLAAALALMVGSTGAWAQCYGTGNFKTCNDVQTGNSYTVQKYGNQTNVTGYNSRTGSSWQQQSQKIGNTTYQNGTSADGNTWNQTIRSSSYGTTYSGTDSDGNYFHKYCPSTGCK